MNHKISPERFYQTRSPRRLSALAVILIGILVGCSPPVPPGNFVVAQPETIQADGLDWQKQEWTNKIETKVTNHFRKSPLLADNPSLYGDMVCYTNGSKQRVYWLSTMEGVSNWAMIEFQGTRGGDLAEGTGTPFQELVLVE